MAGFVNTGMNCSRTVKGKGADSQALYSSVDVGRALERAHLGRFEIGRRSKKLVAELLPELDEGSDRKLKTHHGYGASLRARSGQ